MSLNMIKFLLLSPSFFIFYPSVVISQTRPSSDGSHGRWNLLSESVGISAMHMQLMHDNKVVIYDRTDFGPSNISLPGGLCRVDPDDEALKIDCTAHSILYDTVTDTYRPLMVQTDTWCSSGAVLPNGTLVQTGGFHDGDNVTRMFTPCTNDSCDWVEFPEYLSRRRWYATNQILPDGRIIIIGGRREFNYEFFPRSSPRQTFQLSFLRETREGDVENNLYPFVHLLPDGNLFIFANTRSILFDYNQNRVVREFPSIPGGDPRNYPSTGSSVLLPLDENEYRIDPEVLVCGVIYHPSHPSDQRFSVMPPSPRPRMYHSAAILLADGRVLVGGGNPHIYYNFTNVVYPTDLSLETFSPPYLSPDYASVRPVILSVDETISRGQRFLIDDIIYDDTSSYTSSVLGPSSSEIAPPGYYMLFVVHSGIPSSEIGKKRYVVYMKNVYFLFNL
ncbi:aldehyde oxidase GLOX [Populus alba x Populus x berolinensis]|nr:aldehyde oxidase GLOX [Populus alba x Populus x berolinensis]